MATSFDKNDKLPGKSATKAKPARKGATPASGDRTRRAIADDVRRQQSRGERRKNVTIVGVCVLVALVIVGAAAYSPLRNWYQLRDYRGKTISQIGASASVCGKITTKKATASQQHVPEGTNITYTDAPPTFGKHYPTPTPIDKKFYTATDRPDLGYLVHNLEHGYTILWYDTTVAKSATQMNQLKALADKLDSTTDLRQKFKIAPWLPTDENGKKFPSGQHVALTHWAAHVAGAPSTDTQAVGVTQYCSAVSGAALKSFMFTYDYTNSPEPTGA